jgi:hypothetical protein
MEITAISNGMATAMAMLIGNPIATRNPFTFRPRFTTRRYRRPASVCFFRLIFAIDSVAAAKNLQSFAAGFLTNAHSEQRG